MEDRVVGIDLGTTNSLVAYMASGPSLAQPDAPGKGVFIIPGEDGLNLVPSVVALDLDNQMLIGNDAREALLKSPDRAVYSVKRLMGRGVEDVQAELKLFPFHLAEDLVPGEVLRIHLGERTYTPPEISAHILRQLKRNAERFFGATVKQAVITVPAYFNDAQRQATKDAGRIAGLEVLRLVNEPTAASLAYGLDKKQNGTIAVYDFGGGTFDISILKLQDGIFEVVATNGDTHLGGDDIDNLLIAVAVQDIAGDLGVDVRQYPDAVQRLRRAVIEAKIALSSRDTADIQVELPEGKLYQRRITREMFEQMVQPIVDRTLEPCRKALKDAGLTASQVDEVVLVGGSTRIPLVRRQVEALFARKPHTELNPDEVVALGAAVQANILAGGSDETKDMLLLDVTPLSLGIEALGGVTAVIIQRNSTIPASATEHFTTGVDGQVSVAIHVLQGERELAKDCRSLARFDLKGIPPMPAGLPRIEVRFLIDANGILHVSAREQRSGKEAKIEVQPSYGLTDDQVEKMILDSYDNAESDMLERLLIEARNEAQTILAALVKSRSSEAWKMLSITEQRKVDELESKLRLAMSGDDHNSIQWAIDELNKATMHLAELMMDAAVGSALKGKTMESADVGEGPTAPHPIGKAEFS
ncbi:MAG: molecular chaperone DnaK [Acidobacteria bacterium]|nr:MAG: molecular chaperone DnaK [Acidobacteriota bacterium]